MCACVYNFVPVIVLNRLKIKARTTVSWFLSVNKSKLLMSVLVQ